MAFIADTHVHFHPAHRLGKACLRAESQLRRLAESAGAPAAARVLLLTEGAGHQAFADLRAGRLRPERHEVRVSPGDEPEALRMRVGDAELHVLAGRQVVAAERIEILALAVDAAIPDGRPLAEIVQRVCDAGGVPVLGWAPGKWMFRRARVVAALLRQYGPETLLLGDTSLRPLGWGEPGLMRAARARGYRVVAGSDPLPIPGDDAVMGSYASLFEAPFDPARPVAAVRAALVDPVLLPRTLGRRGSAAAVARRLWRHARR